MNENLLYLGFKKVGDQYIKLENYYLDKSKIIIKYIFHNNNFLIYKYYKGIILSIDYYTDINIKEIKSIMNNKFVSSLYLFSNQKEKEDIKKQIKVIDFYKKLKRNLKFLKLSNERKFIIYFEDVLINDTDKIVVKAWIDIERLLDKVDKLDPFFDVFKTFFIKIDEMLDKKELKRKIKSKFVYEVYMNFNAKYLIRKNKEDDFVQKLFGEANYIVKKLKNEVNKIIQQEQLKQKL